MQLEIQYDDLRRRCPTLTPWLVALDNYNNEFEFRRVICNQYYTNPQSTNSINEYINNCINATQQRLTRLTLMLDQDERSDKFDEYLKVRY